MGCSYPGNRSVGLIIPRYLSAWKLAVQKQGQHFVTGLPGERGYCTKSPGGYWWEYGSHFKLNTLPVDRYVSLPSLPSSCTIRTAVSYKWVLLPEFTTLVYSGLNGIARERPSVRPSVCPSVCSRFNKPISMTEDILSTVCESVREPFCATTCLRVTSCLCNAVKCYLTVIL
jgi:hypothetical protein